MRGLRLLAATVRSADAFDHSERTVVTARQAVMQRRGAVPHELAEFLIPAAWRGLRDVIPG
jgi:hypothetical protein